VYISIFKNKKKAITLSKLNPGGWNENKW